MNRKVLCVDDDANVLRGFERNLRLHFEVETAVGPARGLAAIQQRGPYAVVVSDLRMPEMDGIRFLSSVRKLAPDSVRLILSGNADFPAATAAIEDGTIFQFLTKPCAPDKLRNAIGAALKQHRLVTAERELVEVILNGSIGMMAEALAAANPLAFDRSARMRRYVRHMATHLRLPNLWEFDVAAMLSQVGCVSVPSEIVEKQYAGTALTSEEEEIFTSHPLVAHKLLSGMRPLEEVAEIVRYQMTPFRELQALDVLENTATGAQMLMIAHEYDTVVSRGAFEDAALSFMRHCPETYQPRLVDAMESIDAAPEMEVRTVRLRDLRPGMILDQDIRATNGLLLVASGHILSDSIIATLLNSRFAGWDGSFSVRVPAARPAVTEVSAMPARPGAVAR